MDINALRKIGYGMYLVGSKNGEKLNAQVANTVFQITSEPPTIAVSINKKNLTHEFIAGSGVFSVNVLSEETPLPFIGRFGFRSGREFNKLEGVQFKTGTTGAPLITENAVACLEAKVLNSVDAGTHTIFIGEMVNAEILNDKPTMTYEFYQKVKRGTTPKTAPSYIEKKPAA